MPCVLRVDDKSHIVGAYRIAGMMLAEKLARLHVVWPSFLNAHAPSDVLEVHVDVLGKPEAVC